MKLYCVLLDDFTIIKAVSNRQLKNALRINRQCFSSVRAIRFWKEYEK